MSVTDITLTGNLTRDPEVKYTPSGKEVTNFSVACTPRFQRNGEWENGETSFYEVDAWEPLSDHVTRVLEKGSAVIVEGTGKVDTWEDSDGNNRSKFRVTANRVSLPIYLVESYERKQKNGTTTKAKKKPAKANKTFEEEDPF